MNFGPHALSISSLTSATQGCFHIFPPKKSLNFRPKSRKEIGSLFSLTQIPHFPYWLCRQRKDRNESEELSITLDDFSHGRIFTKNIFFLFRQISSEKGALKCCEAEVTYSAANSNRTRKKLILIWKPQIRKSDVSGLPSKRYVLRGRAIHFFDIFYSLRPR